MQFMVVMFKIGPSNLSLFPSITCQSKLNKTSPSILRLFIFIMIISMVDSSYLYSLGLVEAWAGHGKAGITPLKVMIQSGDIV